MQTETDVARSEMVTSQSGIGGKPSRLFMADVRTLQVTVIACLVSCCVVALDLWKKRDLFDPEGITYLDMADGYRRGDWGATLVGLWSPLYPWLLSLALRVTNPSAYWEFTVVHAFNFGIYVGALVSFTLFMREFLRYERHALAATGIPDWVWCVLGYSLFTWSTIRLMPPHFPEPDSIVCALVYLIFTLLLRMRRQALTWPGALLLGALLALAYYAKAVMFPMGFVFIGVALWVSRDSARKVLVALLVFLALCAPYIVALSNANGRWMFSDAGRLNYAWEINGVEKNGITKYAHWQGEGGEYGRPIHPTRRINDSPAVYEFGTPFNVTYPPWYNPSYWYEGMKPRIDLSTQLSVLARNAKRLFFFLVMTPGSITVWNPTWMEFEDTVDGTIGPLATLLLAIAIMGWRRTSALREIGKRWFILAPIGAVFAAYSLLHFEGRYIAAYVVVLWMTLFQSVAFSDSKESARALTALLLTASIGAVLTLAAGVASSVWAGTRVLLNRDYTEASTFQSGYTNWKVATFLHQAGVNAGDAVGAVGWTYGAYWARMARVRIVVEIPADSSQELWSMQPPERDAVMQLLRRAGARIVVANRVPPGAAPTGWQQIGNTGFFAHVFQGDGAKDTNVVAHCAEQCSVSPCDEGYEIRRGARSSACAADAFGNANPRQPK